MEVPSIEPSIESEFPPLTGRKHLRTLCRKAATIVVTPDMPVIRCTVIDISESGVGLSLRIDSPYGIPDTFSLIIDGEPKQYACRVVWKQAYKIGVEFQ
jgi:hypothetical protein